MRKRIHQEIEVLEEKTQEEAAIDIGHWWDPIFLSQEINKELYDINISINTLIKIVKIQGWLLVFLVMILIATNSK